MPYYLIFTLITISDHLKVHTNFLVNNYGFDTFVFFITEVNLGKSVVKRTRL